MLSTTTKSTTTKRYLKAASSVPLNHKQLDPLLDTRGLEFQYIKDILPEVKQWESMLNRREPVNVKMVLHMHDKYKNKHRDSLDFVSLNWNVLGILYSFRLSEWAQNISDKIQPLASSESLPLSFVLPDLTFLDADRTTIPQSWSAQLHNTGIEFVQLRWRPC